MSANYHFLSIIRQVDKNHHRMKLSDFLRQISSKTNATKKLSCCGPKFANFLEVKRPSEREREESTFGPSFTRWPKISISCYSRKPFKVFS